MRLRAMRTVAGIMLALAHAAPALSQSLPSANHVGKQVYDRACATCHAAPADSRTPTFAALAGMPAGQLRDAMAEGGKMAPMAATLSTTEKSQLVTYLTSGQIQTAGNWTDAIACAPAKRVVDVAKPIASSGFGVDKAQTRSLTSAQSGLKKQDLRALEIAWAIGFPGQGSGTGASIVGDTMFIAGGGRLLALDTASGCAKWSMALSSRNTPAFGEINGRAVVALAAQQDVLVVDATTGEKVWQASGQATDNVGAIRGGVAIYKDRIIVPISASGVTAAIQPKFECCIGHGAVVALSAKDGAKLWEYHTMPTAQYTGKISSTGVRQRGPSGAPIWSVPVIDEQRNRVIVTTGENTSHPGTDTSDAIIALDLETGKEVWKFQALTADIWNMACVTASGAGPNCPWNVEGDTHTGRDFDFGAGAMIVKGAGGKDLVLAGQKSGDTWALDADTGKVVWNVRFGEGTWLGGIHWGLSTDGERLFAPINDPLFDAAPASRQPGVFAVDIKTGERLWGFDAKPNCAGERGKAVVNCASKYGFSAAPLTIDGAVIAATLGGEVLIFDGENGEVITRLDTIGPHKTINGIAGKGGSIDSHAISAGAGMIFINSGYSLFDQTPGNVLMAYKPKR